MDTLHCEAAMLNPYMRTSLRETLAVTTVYGLEPSGRALADADKVLVLAVLSPSSPTVVSSRAVSVAVGSVDSYLPRLFYAYLCFLKALSAFHRTLLTSPRVL